MFRRDFVKSSLALTALAARPAHPSAAPAVSPEPPVDTFPKAPGLTKYVAEFIVNTKYEDIPKDVLDLGRKSMLDGFGLALAGSASVLAPLVRQYVKSLGIAEGHASVIGTAMKSRPRFAAF